MALVIEIIVGICGCFFSPAINSAITDIVSKSKLIKANSVLSLASTANYMLGNAVGGFIVQILESGLDAWTTYVLPHRYKIKLYALVDGTYIFIHNNCTEVFGEAYLIKDSIISKVQVRSIF